MPPFPGLDQIFGVLCKVTLPLPACVQLCLLFVVITDNNSSALFAGFLIAADEHTKPQNTRHASFVICTKFHQFGFSFSSVNAKEKSKFKSNVCL